MTTDTIVAMAVAKVKLINIYIINDFFAILDSLVDFIFFRIKLPMFSFLSK